MKTLAYHYNLPRIGAMMAASRLSKNPYGAGFSPVYFDKMKDPKLPREDFVRVRNIQTGICGSDMSLYMVHQSTKMSLAMLPSYQTNTYMGHETVGIVEEAGRDVKNVKVGDRVVLKKYLPCCATKGIPEDEWCEPCKHDDYVVCEKMGQAPRKEHVVGAGMGDQYIAPSSCVMSVSDAISDDYATMIEPCAVSLHTVMKKIPQKGDKVVVFGGGMIGLNICQFVKLLQPDCTVYMMTRSKLKQDIALRVGGDKIITGNIYEYLAKETGSELYTDKFNKKSQWLMNGVDIVYDSIGKEWAFNMGLRILRARGAYVKVGIQMTPTTIDETPLWNRELEVIGVDSYGVDEYEGVPYQSFELVKKLMEEGKVDLEGFITHRFPLSEYKAAFNQNIVDGHNSIKVVLECDK